MTTLRLSGPDRVRLVASREGRGTPIVLVHGSGGGLDSWAPVSPHLGDDVEVWTYARRGYPPSDPGPGSYDDQVADLAAVIDACGGTPHLVGGSVGATIALHYALGRADRLRSLTLFEPPLYAAGDELAPLLLEHRDLVGRGLVGTAGWLFATGAARAPQTLVGARPVDESPTADPAELTAARAHTIDLEAMVADSTDLHRWAGVSVPTLLLQGSDTWDPMPATMDALAAALPGEPRRVTFDGHSHFAPHTAPREFATAVRSFVESF